MPDSCTGYCTINTYNYVIWFFDTGVGPVLPLVFSAGHSILRIRGLIGYRLVLDASLSDDNKNTLGPSPDVKAGAWAMGSFDYGSYMSSKWIFLGLDYRRFLQPSYASDGFYLSVNWVW